MEEGSSLKAFRDESAKSTKSVAFGKLSTPQKTDRNQQVPSPQATSSMSVDAKSNVKIEDKLNYYHLVELNKLFKVRV